MSVTSMTTVFKAEINDLSYTKKEKTRIAKASTVKLLLLAYADCANDEGESAYPGFTLLEIKTALSRQGIADTIEACEQNSFLFPAGKSKRRTKSPPAWEAWIETWLDKRDAEWKEVASRMGGVD